MKIRQGNVQDIPIILDMGELFYGESNFEEGGYDPDHFAKMLNYIMDGCKTHHVLIAETEGEPIGFIIFDCARHYTTYLVACMWLFYVHKDKRIHGAGPELLKAAVEMATEKGCKYFYSSSSAGFDDGGRNERVLKAVYKRQGFAENGIFMRKVLK